VPGLPDPQVRDFAGCLFRPRLRIYPCVLGRVSPGQPCAAVCTAGGVCRGSPVASRAVGASLGPSAARRALASPAVPERVPVLRPP
jgi:hypothetical protein